ncbi:MAG TPA: rhodanese-like domain-containing protein, partial [Steroidobacteraceae bacterium]|nr:rhodanese-like domain-containing protein [Steroidobacteraceae bacterium]
LTAQALRALLDPRATPAPPLIDVREPWEYDTGHLPDAVNIPLGELAQRMGEVPRAGGAVFICRSGGRSLRACSLALAAGVAAPANLEGGLLAWAAEIDPTLPVA